MVAGASTDLAGHGSATVFTRSGSGWSQNVRLAAGNEESGEGHFGYSVAHFCFFYQPVRHIEVLGRVMTGEGGKIILAEAKWVLQGDFPEVAGAVEFYEPDEREKRHGQAAAAASLPIVE